MIKPPAWVDRNVLKITGHLTGDFDNNAERVSRNMSKTLKGPDARETYDRSTRNGTTKTWIRQNLCVKGLCESCPLGVSFMFFYRLNDGLSVTDLDNVHDIEEVCNPVT
ncbi:unnamed protein product [Vitrella brassicaformis CCMP3155]|uniref:Uncharacterized protein n=1 Tax=Vitrella brassicaformis (strain CCMP3155) TaxID=1169540 RepID=A0A0G4E8F3_VITBC|nr:unnamed protein product [Vitrella brassicaformis CCMP3155]|eukprot:CEL91739.1 unnamed protein product [Vitrella brassicaformis CCMP3155]